MSSISPISNLFANLCADELAEQFTFPDDLDINEKMAGIVALLKQELLNDTQEVNVPATDRKTVAMSEFSSDPKEDQDQEYPVFNDTQEPLEFCPVITAELWDEIYRRQEEATSMSPEITGINFDYGVTSTYCVPVHGPAVVLKFETVVELLLLLFLDSN
ncbi:hypothetical protein CJU90_0538 [Yarrowia sp. C11]|nr:hypothetical protein CJU90_0538 [Yarrowia sp. C11]